ncbi:hypothetical protein DFH27DRAFT_639763 [Peziza echinospora]|nr:hypothetical protein DFH27DRAFT_639763 [Peziza echinospora]
MSTAVTDTEMEGVEPSSAPGTSTSEHLSTIKEETKTLFDAMLNLPFGKRPTLFSQVRRAIIAEGLGPTLVDQNRYVKAVKEKYNEKLAELHQVGAQLMVERDNAVKKSTRLNKALNASLEKHNLTLQQQTTPPTNRPSKFNRKSMNLPTYNGTRDANTIITFLTAVQRQYLTRAFKLGDLEGETKEIWGTYVLALLKGETLTWGNMEWRTDDHVLWQEFKNRLKLRMLMVDIPDENSPEILNSYTTKLSDGCDDTATAKVTQSSKANKSTSPNGVVNATTAPLTTSQGGDAMDSNLASFKEIFALGVKYGSGSGDNSWSKSRKEDEWKKKIKCH